MTWIFLILAACIMLLCVQGEGTCTLNFHWNLIDRLVSSLSLVHSPFSSHPRRHVASTTKTVSPTVPTKSLKENRKSLCPHLATRTHFQQVCLSKYQHWSIKLKPLIATSELFKFTTMPFETFTTHFTKSDKDPKLKLSMTTRRYDEWRSSILDLM